MNFSKMWTSFFAVILLTAVVTPAPAKAHDPREWGVVILGVVAGAYGLRLLLQEKSEVSSKISGVVITAGGVATILYARDIIAHNGPLDSFFKRLSQVFTRN